MFDATRTAAAYLATWNAEDHDERRRLLGRHWSPDVCYVDPLAEVSGHDGVAALVDGARAQLPGLVFTLLDGVDAHHQQLRFRWALGPQQGPPVVIGSDVVLVDDEGRITDVRGFLDLVPA